MIMIKIIMIVIIMMVRKRFLIVILIIDIAYKSLHFFDKLSFPFE